MKIIRVFTAIIFAIFVSVPYASGAANTYAGAKDSSLGKNNLISMDFQDANLKTVLKIFSQQSGLNFIASQNIQERTVTVYFDNVKVQDALNNLMNANGLVYEQEPGTNIFIVKEITATFTIPSRVLSSVAISASRDALLSASVPSRSKTISFFIILPPPNLCDLA